MYAEHNSLARKQDYRSELIDQLKQSGMTPEEIERWFPKTYEEKREKVRDDQSLLEALHKEVASLRVEVDEIKRQLEARAADKHGQP
jgi:KaiC/GvpD/RAD55 family RecA-like ATPase